MAKIEVNGRIIDSRTNEGLSGAKAILGPYSATTNEFGSYTIEYDLEEGQSPPSTIRFTKGGYAPKQVSAITQSGNPKRAINVAELKPLKLDFGIELPNIIVLGSAQARRVKSSTSSSPESKAVELALKEASNLYERLIPFAAKQLSRFGIQDPNDVENKSCPSFSEINKAITEKNKTTRQLNNSFKTISSLSKASGILEALLKAIKIIFQLLKKNPLPSTLGTPPGPAGGVIISQTMGKITTYDEKREDTKKFIDRLSELVKVFPDATVPISLALSEALSLLSATDTSVGECLDDARQAVVDEINRQQGLDSASTIGDGIENNVGIGPIGPTNGLNTQGGNLSVTDVDFTQIDENRLKDILGIDRDSDIQVGDLLAGNYLQVELDKELTSLTEEAAGDGQPSVTEYNGFQISVETESEEAAQGKSIKRRFAVGKNKDGVTLVQGDKSYSSNDQILIDELIFKIESEDLKSV